MPEPFEELAPAALLPRGDAFLRAVAGVEAALPVAAFFALAQEELRQAVAEREAASLRSEQAYRDCDEADQRLDGIINDLSLATLELTGDTSGPLFARLFPDGPQAYTFAPIETELRLVRCLRERLEGHPLQARFEPLLEQASGVVADAERRLAAALDVETTAWARTRKAEIAWRLRSRLTRSALERTLRETGRTDVLEAVERLLPGAEHAPSEPAPILSRRQH